MRDNAVAEAVKRFWDVGSASPKELHKISTPRNPNVQPGDLSIHCEKGIRAAIARAVPDITARTMRKHASHKNKDIKDFTDYLTEQGGLYGAIQNWLNRAPEALTEAAYDQWHADTCEKLLPRINDYYYVAQEGKQLAVPYGKAQKVVNMAMKNLYCLAGAEGKEEYFLFCHMPMDSFTLEWLARMGADAAGLAWSNLNETDYRRLVAATRGQLSVSFASETAYQTYNRENYIGRKLTPLQTEFFVWPEIQAEKAAEAFLIQLQEEAWAKDETKSKKAESQKIREMNFRQKKNAIIAELQKIANP